MKTTRELEGKDILLIQDSIFRKNFRLTSDDETIGNLTFPSVFSWNAEFELFGKKWEIRSLNFWKTRIGVFQYGYEMPVAEYSRKGLSKGIIELDKGKIMTFKFGMLKSTAEIKYNDNVVVFSKRRASLKVKQVINITDYNNIVSENSWVIMLLGYIITIRKKSGAAYNG